MCSIQAYFRPDTQQALLVTLLEVSIMGTSRDAVKMWRRVWRNLSYLYPRSTSPLTCTTRDRNETWVCDARTALSNRLVRMRVVILPPLLHTLRSISWLIHKVHMRHVERTSSKQSLRHVFPFLDLFLCHSERKVAWSSTRSWIVHV
jgi:hypothetical protein